jgi:cobalt-zinc-cadmium efflux system outer membrane protein
MSHLHTLCALVVVTAGCSRVPPFNDGSVERLVATRTGQEVVWQQGECQDEQRNAFVEKAISHELTADNAIKIALLNNPKIQASFEELGIAQANLISAGLFSNPTFGVEVRYPLVSGLKTNIEYLLSSSILDVFLIPLRTKLASLDFEQTKLRVSNDILGLAFDVREAFYELVAARKKVRCLQAALELSKVLKEIAANQKSVGNINNLEYTFIQAKLLKAEIDLSESQAETVRLEEKLVKLLGYPHRTSLILPEELSIDFDNPVPNEGAVEAIALEKRLDLQVAAFNLAQIRQMLDMKQWWAFTDGQVGVAGERDPDGSNLLGFGLSGQIPLFNYGQAARMRLCAQLHQAQERVTEIKIRVASEARQAHALLIKRLAIVKDYRCRLLPLQRKIVLESEALYNVMGAGISTLLENKQSEILTLYNYTEAIKQYLLSKVELDKALGGQLSEALTSDQGAER